VKIGKEKENFRIRDSDRETKKGASGKRYESQLSLFGSFMIIMPALSHCLRHRQLPSSFCPEAILPFYENLTGVAKCSLSL
jgi:hypothetical protein